MSTLHDRLKAGLAALGYEEDKTDKSKYTAMAKAGKRRVFIGAFGALRTGDCASRSFSIGDASNRTPIYVNLLEHGDKALNPPLTPEPKDGKL